MVGIDICRYTISKNNKCHVWFISETLWAKFSHDLQDIYEVLSDSSLEYHSILKAVIGEQYDKLISGYETFLNRTKFILSLLNNNKPIQTMAKILEILII